VSRAEERRVPPPTSLTQAVGRAAIDLYSNSMRLVAANLVWAFGLLLVAFLATRTLAALPLAVVVVALSIGLMRMAAHLVRNRHVVLSDFTDAVRPRFLPHFGLGLAQVVLGFIALIDLGIGLQTSGFIGPALTVSAIYALVALWVVGVAAWPILLDPVRADEPVLARLRLGALLTLAHPIRLGGLALLLAILLALSTVLIAALLTVAGTLTALIAAHYVLPAADRIEGRATLEVEDPD
jgi:hypothetical protein